MICRAGKILNSFVTGKFKPEEDEIILREVQRNGDNIDVYKDLCLKLNCDPASPYVLQLLSLIHI